MESETREYALGAADRPQAPPCVAQRLAQPGGTPPGAAISSPSFADSLKRNLRRLNLGSIWDGGYSANPAVFPLFYECDAQDVLLVLLTPLRRDDTPRTVKEIDERITRLSFNATLMREMQTFARAAEFSDLSPATSSTLESKLRAIRFHMIDVCDLASLECAETKALAHAPFLEMLCGQGRERAATWLKEHADDVGHRSSVNVWKWFG